MGRWFGKQAIHSAPTLARTTAAFHLHQDHRLGWITAALVDAVEVPTRTGTWWAGTGSTARTADPSVWVPHTAGSERQDLLRLQSDWRLGQTEGTKLRLSCASGL